MVRLSNASLNSLPADVARPGYTRAALKPGIVHLGLGAFHRAHQAWYTEAVLNQVFGPWGIIGVSLRSTATRDQLVPQDGLYTLIERDGVREQCQVVGAVKTVLVAPEDPAALIAQMADPDIRIISLTVTEKGYCHRVESGDLNSEHPDIRADLADLSRPRSAIGYLVAALLRRREAGVAGFTALSCDNLPDNGRILQKVVTQFAERIDPSLVQWIQAQVTFPCTMVDRITPATTPADLDQLAAQLGVRDEGAVVTEPFSQWVVEDHFACGRPQWELAGVQMVSDVRAFETIKLRLLNGSHSLLAYTGYLAGFEYISSAMVEPAFARMVRLHMTREAGETLVVPEGFDLVTYRQQLCERFANPALKHRTAQVAIDGSQKIPQRLLQPLRAQLAGQTATGGRHIDTLCLALAAWIRFLSGVDERGATIPVNDPLADSLCAKARAFPGDPLMCVRAVVGVTEVFGKDLINNSEFVETTARWLSRLLAQGALATVREYFGDSEPR